MKFERNYFSDIINHDGSLFLLDKFISDKLSYYKSKRNFDLGSYKKNYVSALSPALSRRILTEKKIIARAVSYTHLRAHETREDLVCRLLLEKKKS